MKELFTEEQPLKLKKRFIGKRMKINEVRGREVEIIDFEIGKNRENKDLLFLQLKIDSQPRFFWSEGVKLIKTINQANRIDLPFKTIIDWDNEGRYLLFKKPR